MSRNLTALPSPARSTATSLATGLAASIMGATQQLVAAAMRTLGDSAAPLVVTGGDGALVARSLPGTVTLLPMLVLDGLRMLDEAEGG